MRCVIWYILIVLAASSQAEKVFRYKSDTVIKFEAQPPANYKPCLCEGNHCTPDKKAEDDVCGELLYRLREHLQPVAHFFRCRMNDKMCSESKSQTLHFELLVDQDELTQQPFYQGDQMIGPMVAKLLSRPTILKYRYVDKTTIKTSVEIGANGSPVVMEGILNISKTTGKEAVECWHELCAETINKICKEAEKQFNKQIPDLAQVYLGCRVSRIYELAGNYRVTYAIMIDYPKALSKNIFTGEKDLRSKFQKVIKNMPTSGILKSQFLGGVTLKSNCEYQADVQSYAPYFSQQEDPSSGSSILLAIKARAELAEQVILGQSDGHSCLVDVLDVNMKNHNQLTNYQIRLAFFNSCLAYYKKVSSCQQYTSKLVSEWEQGNNIRHFPKFPKFDFKALTA